MSQIQSYIYNIERGCTKRKGGCCGKLQSTDWLADIPNMVNPSRLVEVRFKNTRFDYYENVNDLQLKIGDMVAVEGAPGYDIGTVSMLGDLVLKQMEKRRPTLNRDQYRKVFRKARSTDIEKWEESIAQEHRVMIESRQITKDLELDMKIGDVEYQGDGTKAIFYYIADGRVDFRQLIRVLADRFSIRVEMKQIGARQEAGRIGGIGPCGRELCCSSWMSKFSSVTTTSARIQELSLTPQKLAGQCGKLKCCLNNETDVYLDAQSKFPKYKPAIETRKGKYVYVKSDFFKEIIYYTLDDGHPSGIIGINIDVAKEFYKQNKEGIIPEDIIEGSSEPNIGFKLNDIIADESLTRFDKKLKKRKKSRKNNNSGNRQNTDNKGQGKPTGKIADKPSDKPADASQGARNKSNKANKQRNNKTRSRNNQNRANPSPNKKDENKQNRNNNRKNENKQM
ncbi:MAG: stage 0 sporulation family protein [Bacteroidales bacterium]